MVGAADKAHFDEASVLLKAMGKNIVHCGAVGTGQVRGCCVTGVVYGSVRVCWDVSLCTG